MATHTYRFKLEVPVSLTQLESEVGVSVSLADYAGGAFADIECDDSRAQDLMDAMAVRGYAFVEGDPSDTAAEGFRASNGITGVQEHRTLRQLIHFIDNGPAEGFASGAHEETVGTVFPSSITWWESVGKLKKIVERLITWTGVNPTTDKWKIYDVDGSTVLWTVSDAISYSGVFKTGMVRTITLGDA